MRDSYREIDLRVSVYLNWDQSFSKIWDTEEARHFLRDTDIAELAEKLTSAITDTKVKAVIELVEHGNLRRAAELTRQLERVDRRFKYQLEQKTDTKFVRHLLRADLESIPSKPSEYHPKAKRMYIL